MWDFGRNIYLQHLFAHVLPVKGTGVLSLYDLYFFVTSCFCTLQMRQPRLAFSKGRGLLVILRFEHAFALVETVAFRPVYCVWICVLLCSFQALRED